MTKLRIIYFLLISALLINACNRNKNYDKGTGETYNVSLKGFLEQGEGKTVYLEIMGGTAFIPLDTTTCNEHGEFMFRFRTDHPAFYALRAFYKGYVTLLMEPGENAEFQGNYLDAHKYHIKDSPGSELINDLATEHKKIIDGMAEISKKTREALEQPDYSEIKPDLDLQFDSLATTFYNYSIDFIHGHSNSLAILIALYNQYGYGLPVFNLAADKNVYQFVDSSLYSKYPENESVKLLHNQLVSTLQGDRSAIPSNGPAIGKKAPDFGMKNRKGEMVALRDFRGKYVLLSFWAAWSKPSEEENQYLKQAYKIFKPSGFEIIQVSVDDNPTAWLDAIRTDSLTWCQLSDLKRWDSDVIDLYSVEKIPSNYLISPDGTVLDKDLFGDNLIKALHKWIN